MKTCGCLAALLLAAALPAQSTAKRKTGLPDPPKPDVPYLIHAETLIETQIAEAKEETRQNEQLASIPGAVSGVKTPLASPEFLFQSDKIPVDKLQLHRMESKGGRREIVLFRKKKPAARPHRLTVFRIHENLYKLRVDDSLPPGEYSLSPDGSNAVYCFTVE